MDDHEKIVSPTAIPRTSWDHFLRMCFWTLVVPAVSLILLSFMSWFIWMRLKWLTPDRYERENSYLNGGNHYPWASASPNYTGVEDEEDQWVRIHPGWCEGHPFMYENRVRSMRSLCSFKSIEMIENDQRLLFIAKF